MFDFRGLLDLLENHVLFSRFANLHGKTQSMWAWPTSDISKPPLRHSTRRNSLTSLRNLETFGIKMRFFAKVVSALPSGDSFLPYPDFTIHAYGGAT
jgi:hypothetical protein